MGHKILYVGAQEGTSLQRARALAELGNEVVRVEAGPGRHRFWHFQLYRVLHRVVPAPDVFASNRTAYALARSTRFDVVWVDRGLTIRPETLRRIRAVNPGAVLVSYSPDDMLNPTHQSPKYLSSVPLYDLHVTTKSYNVHELPGLGAKRVFFVDNAFDPALHRPMELRPEEARRYATSVGFIGFVEEERVGMLLRLAEEGFSVTVRGPGGWRGLRRAHPNLRVAETFLEGEEYTKAINATEINLGFLRKANRDLQTTRSIEIPACAGFLLAERTPEHTRLFEEGKEAEFFSSADEMVEKCRYYLAHPEARRRIALAGRDRCLRSGYSNHAVLAKVLEEVDRLRLPDGRLE